MLPKFLMQARMWDTDEGAGFGGKRTQLVLGTLSLCTRVL